MGPIFHEKIPMGLIFKIFQARVHICLKMGTFFRKIPKHGNFLKNLPLNMGMASWATSAQHIPNQSKSENPPTLSLACLCVIVTVQWHVIMDMVFNILH